MPSCTHVWPKSSDCADQVFVPSLMMAVQATRLVQSTVVSTNAPEGTAAAVQVAPPLCVVRTTPAPGTAPVEPTAMQAVAVGHETPLSSGGVGKGTVWPVQVAPPSVVAAITVTAVGEVVAVTLGPAMPTAQQCEMSGHENAPSSPVPAGAGWPTTLAVALCSPRTRVAGAGGGRTAVVHPAATSTSKRRVAALPTERRAR